MNIDNFHFDRAGSFLKNKKKKEKKRLNEIYGHSAASGMWSSRSSKK